jgi:hypothetical protein
MYVLRSAKRSEGKMTPSRPPKLTDAETILHEIDMLRFSASSFRQPCEWNCWRNLECFLLHFRNLIEFFGNKTKGDTLSILRPQKIWTDSATIPSEDRLKPLHRKDLWKKYEVRRKDQVNDKISRYLHHCTEQRVESKNWDVTVMLNELSPTLEAFESLLPHKHRPWGLVQSMDLVSVLPQNTQSTATGIRGALSASPAEGEP